jgi:transposase
MRYELSDHGWVVIKPMLPGKPRGVPCVNDRRASGTGSWRHWRPLTMLRFRRIATRYDKLAASYLAFIRLASIRIRLQAYESTP